MMNLATADSKIYLPSSVFARRMLNMSIYARRYWGDSKLISMEKFSRVSKIEVSDDNTVIYKGDRAPGDFFSHSVALFPERTQLSWDGYVLAGGAVCALLGNFPGYNMKDLDFFIVVPGLNSMSPQKKQESFMEIYKKMLIEFHQVFKITHVVRNEWCTTLFRAGRGTGHRRSDKPCIQIIHRAYHCEKGTFHAKRVIEGFDIQPAQVYIHGKDAFMTSACAMSHLSGTFVLDVSRFSSTGAARISKYTRGKRFSCIIPGMTTEYYRALKPKGSYRALAFQGLQILDRHNGGIFITGKMDKFSDYDVNQEYDGASTAVETRVTRAQRMNIELSCREDFPMAYIEYSGEDPLGIITDARVMDFEKVARLYFSLLEPGRCMSKLSRMDKGLYIKHVSDIVDKNITGYVKDFIEKYGKVFRERVMKLARVTARVINPQDQTDYGSFNAINITAEEFYPKKEGIERPRFFCGYQLEQKTLIWMAWRFSGQAISLLPKNVLLLIFKYIDTMCYNEDMSLLFLS